MGGNIVKKVFWWCPECRLAITNLKPCPKCGHEKVKSWRCDQCPNIVVNNHTCSCGRKRSAMIYGRMVVKKLFEDTGPRGHKNIDIIRRFAYAYANNHNMPLWFVEDALAEALHNIVKHFKQYDNSREFRTWAIAIVKNVLADMAKEDIAKNSEIAFSLDDNLDGDTLVMERVLGYTYGVDDLIAAEEKSRFRVMATLARKVFGYVATIVDGQYADLSVYDVAVEAYQERDGWGWQSAVASETGLSRSLINRRQDIARKTWQNWNTKEE